MKKFLGILMLVMTFSFVGYSGPMVDVESENTVVEYAGLEKEMSADVEMNTLCDALTCIHVSSGFVSRTQVVQVNTNDGFNNFSRPTVAVIINDTGTPYTAYNTSYNLTADNYSRFLTSTLESQANLYTQANSDNTLNVNVTITDRTGGDDLGWLYDLSKD